MIFDLFVLLKDLTTVLFFFNAVAIFNRLTTKIQQRCIAAVPFSRATHPSDNGSVNEPMEAKIPTCTLPPVVCPVLQKGCRVRVALNR